MVKSTMNFLRIVDQFLFDQRRFECQKLLIEPYEICLMYIYWIKCSFLRLIEAVIKIDVLPPTKNHSKYINYKNK